MLAEINLRKGMKDVGGTKGVISAVDGTGLGLNTTIHYTIYHRALAYCP